jgi:hypothetical protein
MSNNLLYSLKFLHNFKPGESSPNKHRILIPKKGKIDRFLTNT